MEKSKFDLFDVEKQYQTYLERAGVKEAQFSPIQATETKRAFYGAWGQLLILMRDELGVIPMDLGTILMQEMLIEVCKYWADEAEKENKFKQN